MRPEGCHEHWKAKIRVPCSECGKPTGSTSGRCPLHVKGYYVIQYVNRLRVNARMAEMLEEARMLEDAKLLEDARRLEEGYSEEVRLRG